MTRTPVSIAAIGAAITLLPGAVWAQMTTDPDRYGWGPHMMGWGGGWYGIIGPIFMILVLALVIAVAVLLVRWLGGSAPTATHQPQALTPLDILKERFARGEIDKQEFEERRRVLGE